MHHQSPQRIQFMPLLIVVSIIWAFSFGLMGYLVDLDPMFVATARLGLAWLCFAPFFRRSGLSNREMLQLTMIGVLQFGLMYVCYIKSYAWLPSHLVALFSVFTPLYIIFADNIFQRRWRWSLAGCAVLSIAGAAVIEYTQPVDGNFWAGFGLMQIANLSFGLGQYLYRHWRLSRPEFHDRNVIAVLYLGGAIFAGIAFLIGGDFSKASPSFDQWKVIIYLGIVASGIGFFLWNKGAVQSTPVVLAVFNNAKVPLAMAVSLFVFGEFAEIDGEAMVKLAFGALFIVAAIVWGKRL